ncbi:hypothetical protein ACT3CE_00380 [Marinifilum sp. RC60d5]|uniref:hypothetical protein n=1 Tax=Marinifilum sp. RC60d5 TaxID=3458414 RepID=UPI0040351B8A
MQLVGKGTFVANLVESNGIKTILLACSFVAMPVYGGIQLSGPSWPMPIKLQTACTNQTSPSSKTCHLCINRSSVKVEKTNKKASAISLPK